MRITERTLTTDLTTVIEAMFPKGVVLKHSDRFTPGIPDMTVSALGHTTWIEVKYVRRTSSLFREIKPKQLWIGRLLQRATGGRAWFAVYYEVPREFHLIAPSAINLAKQTLVGGPTHTTVGYDHTLVRRILTP